MLEHQQHQKRGTPLTLTAKKVINENFKLIFIQLSCLNLVFAMHQLLPEMNHRIIANKRRSVYFFNLVLAAACICMRCLFLSINLGKAFISVYSFDTCIYAYYFIYIFIII